MRKFALIAALALSGCTTTATRLAIQNYELSETRKQEAFDNAHRTANEQMHLNLTQYVKANPDKAIDAINATWVARDVLEEIRVQYLLGRELSEITVGQYLYDQQGWINSMAEDNSRTLKKTSDSIQAANKAAGVNSWKDIIPKGFAPASPATKPAGKKSVLQQLEELDK